MKKVTVSLVALLFAFAQSAFAASVSKPAVNVSAVVSSNLQLNMALYKNSVAVANDITAGNAMAFGTLKDVGTGTLRSSTTGSTGTGSVVALLSAISTGVPYTITQNGTALTSGVNTLPAGATTVVPVYAPEDNGGQALVGTLGTAGSWVNANKTLYTSNAAAAGRVIQAHYSVTDDPAAGATTGVPTSQAAGTYTATVTFTVTA
ncbi:MAG TPA: hypothetical protein VL404_03265 [Candidatus Eisenbacteria bacterium]|nr:hypothetical protein [Candidatus Eisenbacteria bacterium]